MSFNSTNIVWVLFCRHKIHQTLIALKKIFYDELMINRCILKNEFNFNCYKHPIFNEILKKVWFCSKWLNVSCFFFKRWCVDLFMHIKPLLCTKIKLVIPWIYFAFWHSKLLENKSIKIYFYFYWKRHNMNQTFLQSKCVFKMNKFQ